MNTSSSSVTPAVSAEFHNCGCGHEHPEVMHCFPCCEAAPCGQDRIKSGFVAFHVLECPKCQEIQQQKVT